MLVFSHSVEAENFCFIQLAWKILQERGNNLLVISNINISNTVTRNIIVDS